MAMIDKEAMDAARAAYERANEYPYSREGLTAAITAYLQATGLVTMKRDLAEKAVELLREQGLDMTADLIDFAIAESRP